mgnify:CR=1 FL=1
MQKTAEGPQDISQGEAKALAEMVAAARAPASGPCSRYVGCVVDASHMVERNDGAPFDRAHYYAEPHAYSQTFHTDIAPHASAVVGEAADVGIGHLWMQPGAESGEALDRARGLGLSVIADGSCILDVLGYHD